MLLSQKLTRVECDNSWPMVLFLKDHPTSQPRRLIQPTHLPLYRTRQSPMEGCRRTQIYTLWITHLNLEKCSQKINLLTRPLAKGLRRHHLHSVGVPLNFPQKPRIDNKLDTRPSPPRQPINLKWAHSSAKCQVNLRSHRITYLTSVGVRPLV